MIVRQYGMKRKFSPDDRNYVRIALSLAKKGKRRVSPNPMVGCVLVKDGAIVGRGYHEYFGGPHAEVNALRHAGARAAGSTMYVTLEPCNHSGKTPPCTRAIIASKVKRVVVAALDPDAKVRGKGIRALREHSIQVSVGLLRRQAEKLNAEYVESRADHRGFVMVKAALSADGKIAARTGDSKWITSEKSRAWVHKLRSRVDAVIIGRKTAVRDNPHLTSHGVGRNPVRVILDPSLKTPAKHRVFNADAPTIVFSMIGANDRKAEMLRRKRIMVVPLADHSSRFNMKEVMKKLRQFSLNKILIEGGGETIGSAFEAKIVTDVAFFLAPIIIGGRDARSAVEGSGVERVTRGVKLKNMDVKSIGRDVLITAKVDKK